MRSLRRNAEKYESCLIGMETHSSAFETYFLVRLPYNPSVEPDTTKSVGRVELVYDKQMHI